MNVGIVFSPYVKYPIQSFISHLSVPCGENNKSKLNRLGFVLSPTQISTPQDGNCLFHMLYDQHGFLFSHKDARNQIVTNLKPMLERNLIFWVENIRPDEWIDQMKKDGTYGDHRALQIAANLNNRDIVFIPSRQFIQS